jgi:hypothetical protein
MLKVLLILFYSQIIIARISKTFKWPCEEIHCDPSKNEEVCGKNEYADRTFNNMCELERHNECNRDGAENGNLKFIN